MEDELIENNIQLISKQTMELFLKQERPSDLIALYMFYYYTAKWQETNQIHATTGYTAKGMKWTDERVQRAKKELIDLSIIEEIKKRDESNRITGWYIKIKYIWKESSFTPLPPISSQWKCQPVGKAVTNALSAFTLNALSVSNKQQQTLSDCFLDITFKSPPEEYKRIIEYYKAVKGYDRVEKWDTVNFARHIRPAQKYLKLCKSWENEREPAWKVACFYIKELAEIYRKQKRSDSSWTIETVMRDTPAYRARQIEELKEETEMEGNDNER